MKKLLITCEHASCLIPREFQLAFKGQQKQLHSHLGWDIGALKAYQAFVTAFPAAYHQHANWSRLLIELNRSLDHPSLFSKWTKTLSRDDKAHIIKRYYAPYRHQLLLNLEKRLARERNIIHIAVHSFTPVFNHKVRDADIGLLYDPSRKAEVALAAAWRHAIQSQSSDYRVRMNYPYWGKTDGLCSALRQAYPERSYVGIELEINQALLSQARSANRVVKVIKVALKSVFEDGIF
jgi:predicted N-formylglutamate amidohydrolase